MNVDDVVKIADLFRSQPSRAIQVALLGGLIHGVVGDWSREEKLQLIGVLVGLWSLDRSEDERLN